ncbi:hypothetical protein [Acidithiobacillus thiooxidans]|uniref:hypothetical protein n=1 Tax=Acidithiobacillus thiooxidans TaxID=930 RepID=UPI003B50BDCC
MRDALNARLVVCVSGSYSHSLTERSLVFFDEHFETGKGAQVTLQDIDLWACRTQDLIDASAFVVMRLDEESSSAKKKAARLQKALLFFQKLAASMAAWVGKTGAISVDKDLVSVIRDIVYIAKKTKNDIDLADWESLHFSRTGELEDAPLRAAHAIAESLKFGDGYVEKGALVIAASLPVMERIAQGQPTIVMDATPGPVIVDVVAAQGGRVVAAIAKQNVRIRRYVDRFWGLSELNEKKYGPKRVQQSVDRYKSLIRHHAHDFESTAFLIHRRAFVAAGFSVLDRTPEGNPIGYSGELGGIVALGNAGYWGRDHRAHDHWSGKELVIVGGFYPPDKAVRPMYQVSRIAALAGGADPRNWPVWRDDMAFVRKDWICEGSADVICKYPLPSDPHIRKWLLSRITAETVQAIGRARGANNEETIDVHIYGGIPLSGLGQHGLAVESYESDPQVLGRRKTDADAEAKKQHEESLAKCDDLAARIIAKGGTVTRDSMQATVDEMNSSVETPKTGDEEGGELHSSHPRIYIHTGVGRIETAQETMPRKETVQQWIRERMPILAAHMSTKGQNGRLVREAQEMARVFGEKALADAMLYAETLAIDYETAESIVDAAFGIIEITPGVTKTQVRGAQIAVAAMSDEDILSIPWETERPWRDDDNVIGGYAI